MIVDISKPAIPGEVIHPCSSRGGKHLKQPLPLLPLARRDAEPYAQLLNTLASRITAKDIEPYNDGLHHPLPNFNAPDGKFLDAWVRLHGLVFLCCVSPGAYWIICRDWAWPLNNSDLVSDLLTHRYSYSLANVADVRAGGPLAPKGVLNERLAIHRKTLLPDRQDYQGRKVDGVPVPTPVEVLAAAGCTLESLPNDDN